MAGIGLSFPCYAKYAWDGTKVTRTGGGVMGKATSLNITPNTSDANVLYGDNGPAESDNTFTGGTVTIGTTDLMPEVAQDVLGAVNVPIESSLGLETQDASWTVYDDDQLIPYISFGGVRKKMINGQIKWVAIVLEKIQLNTPAEEATTQGETIDWQTSELEGTILRSDEGTHPWKRVSSLLDSEEDAKKLLRSYLSITDTPTVEPLQADTPAVRSAGAAKASADISKS